MIQNIQINFKRGNFKMTKLKAKKMSKSTFAVIIMAIVMVAMLAFGGTYAYFTDTQSVGSQAFTTGKIDLTAGSVTQLQAAKLMPGDTLTTTGSVSLSDDSDDAYVGLIYTESLGTNTGNKLVASITGGENKAWTKAEVTVDETDYVVYVYTGAGTTPVAAEATNNFTISVTLDWTAGNEYQAQTGISVGLEARAVQLDNFAANMGGADLETVAEALVKAVVYTPAG